MNTLYTIGYARLRPEDLRAIAIGLDATVIDVRHKPVSRKPGFGGKQLAALLGDRYQAHGHHLGGNGHVAQTGIDALDDLLDTHNLILLCLEEAPGDCHRHHDICGPLFPEALHIFRNEIFTAEDLATAIDTGGQYPILDWLSDLLPAVEHPAQPPQILA